jgi:hypothetical protein
MLGRIGPSVVMYIATRLLLWRAPRGVRGQNERWPTEPVQPAKIRLALAN